MRLASRLLVVLTLVACASDAEATKLAGEFLTTGLGAKALGMGGAFVSVADDASASYWNPAGLQQIDRSQVLLMHSERFGGLVDYNCFTVARPISRGESGQDVGALSLLWLRVSDIAMTSHLNEPGVDFEDLNDNGIWDPGTERRLWNPDRVRMDSDDEIAGLVSYSHKINADLALGVSAKVVWKQIAEISCLGFGVDGSMLYEVRDGWKVGVNLQDATTTPLFWDGWYETTDLESGERVKRNVTTTETITPTLKVGTSYRIPLAAISGRLLVAADCDFKFEGLAEDEADFSFSKVSGDVRLGAQYGYKGLLHVSAGMDRRKPTAGIGLKISRFGVDYAFWRDTELDNTHRISAGMDF